MIVLHGFGSSKDLKSNTKFGERLSSKYKGYAALAFDFPCHSDDARKKLSVEESITYLQLVIDYAKTSLNAKNLYAYGTSFGGYLTLKYLAEKGNPFRKIALRAPAVQIYHSLMNRLSRRGTAKTCQRARNFVGFDRQMKISQAFLMS